MLQDLKNARFDFDTEIGLNVVDISLKLNDTIPIPIEDEVGGLKPIIQLVPGENDMLELQISQEFPGLTLDSFNLTKDTLLSKEINLPMFSDFYAEGSMKFGFNLNTFSKNGKLSQMKIDSIKLDDGLLKIDLNTYRHFYSSFSFRFPGITDENNEMLSIENFTPNSQKHIIEIDLSNYKIEVLLKNLTEYFLIELDYYLESNNSNNPDTPKVNITLQDLDIDYIYGNLGRDTIRKNQIEEIELFKKPLFGEQEVIIDLQEPEISLNVRNQMGLPFGIYIDSASMYFKESPSLKITGLPESIIIDAPDIDEKNTTKATKITLDKNTNLDLLISQSPSKLILGYQMFTNPYNTSQKNYLRDNDTLFTALNMRIPFYLRVSKIELKDSSNLEFFSKLETAVVKPTFIQINSEIANSFPFELYVQNYFVDKNYTILDSLFSSEVKIEGSKTVETPNYITIETQKDKTQIENLYQCTSLITVAKFQTSDADNNIAVKFFNNSELKMELTLLSKLNVNNGE